MHKQDKDRDKEEGGTMVPWSNKEGQWLFFMYERGEIGENEKWNHKREDHDGGIFKHLSWKIIIAREKIVFL